jgi:hypothetical protein
MPHRAFGFHVDKAFRESRLRLNLKTAGDDADGNAPAAIAFAIS